MAFPRLLFAPATMAATLSRSVTQHFQILIEASLRIHREDLERITEPVLVVNDIGGMAVIRERNPDDSHALWFE
jgi:hypothetical protein